VKTLCRDCHALWCTAVDPQGCRRLEDQFWSGDCEKCGKFIEIGIQCSHYDFRTPQERAEAFVEAALKRARL